MSDRLDELRRQRDLARAQLAWLDAQIAQAEAAPGPAVPAAVRGAEARSPEAILEEFRTAPAAIATRAKLGCILYFAGAMALLVLGAGAVFLLYARATRGH